MLIVFEGLDQSGKETQARLLRARLAQDGRRVQALSFPEYETPIGREIRQALDGARDFTPDVMQLLYVANRLEFKPQDCWLGVYWDRNLYGSMNAWICILPMLPIHLTYSALKAGSKDQVPQPQEK